MKKAIPSKTHVSPADSYSVEHELLLEIFGRYQASAMQGNIPFDQYFECLMRLDGARHNHEMHNFLKAEHSMNEHFLLGSLEDDEEV